MKPLPHLLASLLLITAATAPAATYQIDFSPFNLALSTTNYTANRDHATGLSGLNVNPQVVTGATGDEIGAGILYDDVSNLLSFQFAFGEGFGFVGLNGGYLGAELNGSATSSSNYPALNSNGPQLHEIGSSYTAFGASTTSGSYNGSVTLSAAEETLLLDNLLYFNILSSNYSNGEIRGQLVPVSVVPEPSSALLLLGSGLMLLLRRRPAASL